MQILSDSQNMLAMPTKHTAPEHRKVPQRRSAWLSQVYAVQSSQDSQVESLVPLDAIPSGQVPQLGVPIEVPDLPDIARDGRHEQEEGEELEEG